MHVGKIVSCHSCGTKNRVAAYSFKRLPWCGGCGAALAEPAVTKLVRRLYRLRYLVIVIVGLVLLSIWPPTIPSFDLSGLAPTLKSPPPSEACAGRPQPFQGLYARHTNRSGVAPLRIRTASGSSYFVKVADAYTGRPVMSFFLYGGSSFDTQLPRGAFVIKYATGTTWCGDSELFGPSTETSQADRVFQFDDEHEYTIELIAQRNGNLPTKRIDRTNF